jgi:CubicO group peptidase (beta-lactamase class C family)
MILIERFRKMKKRDKLLMFGLPTLATLISVLMNISCTIGLRPLPDTVEVEVERAIDRGLDGIIVYVDKPGATALYTAGWKNRDNKIPADPDALFKIASISKLYIAVACAKLVVNSSLDLEQRLADLLPAYADRIAYSDQITLKMMLQHRSGIFNFSDHPDYPWSDPLKNNADTYDYFLDQEAEFKPNKRYKYSNSNYFLIAEIMDRHLGYSHRDYIQSEILDPLGLENTHHLLSEVDLNDLMSGYFVDYPDDIKYNDFIQPGGSMVATAEDVGIFLRALNDGTVFKSYEQAVYHSVYEYEHTGMVPGYSSIAKYHEDMDAVVVQFVNTSGGNTWMKTEKVYNRIVRILEKNQG